MASLLSLILAVSASASTVVSNTGNTASGGTSMSASHIWMPGTPMPPDFLPGPGINIYTGSAAANSFTTSGEPLPLESATLLLSSSGGFATFSVAIFSDNAGVPGTSLVGLIGGGVPPVGAGSYTYSTADSGGFLLEANTTYWLVAQLTPSSMSTASVTWSDTADLSETSSEGWTLGTKVTQGNSGSLTSFWNQNTESALAFSLNSTAVPEPASAALVLLSGGLLLRRNRRRIAA